MTNATKIIIGLVIAALLTAGIVAYVKIHGNGQDPVSYSTPAGGTPASPTGANGQNNASGTPQSVSSDDIINTEVANGTTTSNLVKQSDTDTQSTSTDDASINDFGTSYNANAVQSMAQTSTENFCTQINQTGIGIDQSIQTKLTALQTSQTASLADIQARRTKIDTTLAADRSQWAQTRQTQYAGLEGNATSDNQTHAIQTFETSLNTAIATRESSVDDAIATFRASVDTDVAAHQQAMLTLANNFKTNADAAIQTAQNSCASNAAPATAQSAFTATMQSAVTNLQTSHTGVDMLATQIQTLTQTRNNTVSQILLTFQTTAQTANTTLKAAMQ